MFTQLLVDGAHGWAGPHVVLYVVEVTQNGIVHVTIPCPHLEAHAMVSALRFGDVINKNAGVSSYIM